MLPSPNRFLIYLQQLDLQQLEQPFAHFWQESQPLVQQLLQVGLVLSAAEAVESPIPAMMASMAPALINVFICVICLV